MTTDLFSHLNWLAVLVAAVAYFMLGAIWYSKALFATQWARAAGLKMDDPSKKGLGKMMLTSFILILLTCLGLALLVTRLDLFVWISGLKLGAVTGLLFACTAVAISFVYESRPTSIYFIDGGYHLVGHIAAAIVLSCWR